MRLSAAKTGLILLFVVVFSACAQKTPEQIMNSARQAYASGQHLAAAKQFLSLIEHYPKSEHVPQAAYLVNVILVLKTPQDALDALLDKLPALDAQYVKALKNYKQGELESATANLAYTLYDGPQEHDILSRTLAEELFKWTNSALDKQYVKWWTITVDNAKDIETDRQDRLWALVSSPQKLVQISPTGEIVQQRPIDKQLIDVSNGYRQSIAFFQDGSYLLHNIRFSSDHHELMRYPFEHARDIATNDTGQVFVVKEVLDVFGELGARIKQVGSTGLKAGRFKVPDAVAASNDRVAVVDRNRLQIFTPQGQLLKTIGKNGNIQLPWGDSFNDVAFDRQGFMFLAGPGIGVLDSNYNPLLHFDQYCHRITVTGRGVIYCYELDGKITAFLPLNGVPHSLAPKVLTAQNDQSDTPSNIDQSGLPQADKRRVSGYEEKRQDLLPSFKPLQATKSQPAPASFKYHGSRDMINSMVVDPLVDNQIWLATDGGLVRYNLVSKESQILNREVGLRASEMHDVYIDTKHKVLWVTTWDVILRFDLNAANTTEETLASDPLNPKKMTVIKLRGPQTGVFPKKFIPDKTDSNILWISSSREMIRYQYDKDVWDYIAAHPDHDTRVVKETIYHQSSSTFYFLSEDYFWSLDLRSGVVSELFNIDSLADQFGKSKAEYGLMLRSMALREKRNRIFILAGEDGAFEYDLNSHKLSEPAISKTLYKQCWPNKVFDIQGTLYFGGESCLGKLLEPDDKATGATTATKIQRYFIKGVFDHRDIVPYPGKPDVLLDGTEHGLFEVHMGTQQLQAHRPGPATPHGLWVSSMENIGNRLWVGYVGRGLSVYSEDHQWTVNPTVSGITRMHNLPDKSQVLTISSHNNGGIFLVDQDTLQAKALKLGIGEQPWWYMYDVWYDGENYYGIGGLGDDNLGLRIYDGKTERRITEADGLPFKVGYLIIPDSKNARILWIASDKGLIKFNTHTLTGKVVNPHITKARQFGNTLWVHKPKIIGYNIKTGKEYHLDAHGRVYYDPNRPAQVWVLHHTNAQLYDLTSKQKWLEVPFDAPTNHGSVTTFLVDNLQQPSVWIGTTHGLLSRRID